MENKLQPQDLRIGNYVKRNGMVVQVDHETFWNVKNKPTEYKPIPLTEEWLLKMSFEKLNNTTFKYNDLILDYISTDEYFETEIKGIYGGYKLIAIKCVHTLQNFIFALTHKELKIDLK